MKALVVAWAMTALSATQPGPGSIDGTWTAEFAGRTFIRLELKTVNGAISGGMALGDIELDGQGEVRRADDVPRGLKHIFAATLRGSTLSFSRKDGDGTDRFELKLLEGGKAGELTFEVSDEDSRELAKDGIPAPKPIRLTKR